MLIHSGTRAVVDVDNEFDFMCAESCSCPKTVVDACARCFSSTNIHESTTKVDIMLACCAYMSHESHTMLHTQGVH